MIETPWGWLRPQPKWLAASAGSPILKVLIFWVRGSFQLDVAEYSAAWHGAVIDGADSDIVLDIT